jgi:hypothetical protein
LAGRSSAKPKPASRPFLSPGERIKGEGERKAQIQFCRSELLIQSGECPQFRGERGEKLTLQMLADRRQVSHVSLTRRPPSCSNKSKKIPNHPRF